MSINEFYSTSIRQLPAWDRLRLASLILDDLAGRKSADLDLNDSWNDDDLMDLQAFSATNATKLGLEEEHNA